MTKQAKCLDAILRRDSCVRGWSYVDKDVTGGEGPLADIVVGVKDVIDVSGMPTEYGSPIFRGNMVSEDAEAVRRLRAAGAVIVGKTVTAEFATLSPGPTRNPHNVEHTPGGSSSGSAAVVADGQAHLALGTQTAGSILRPASYCGILGFKPSFGRYPLHGVLRTAQNLDTLGLFASTLDVLSLADSVIADDKPLPAPRSSLTIGLYRSPVWDMAEVPMQTAFLEFGETLVASGVKVVECDTPDQFPDIIAAQRIIQRRETWLNLGHLERDHADELSGPLREMFADGAAYSEEIYQEALETQRQARKYLPQLFGDTDLLLVPGATGAAPRGLDATGDAAFQRMWTALGLPCLGFPVKWLASGLPLGVQLIGQFYEDRQLLSDARAILNFSALKENVNV